MLGVVVKRVELHSSSPVRFVKFVWEDGELWMRMNRKLVEVEVPEGGFAVKVGTGKGQTAGVAFVDKNQTTKRFGMVKCAVYSEGEERGEIEMVYQKFNERAKEAKSCHVKTDDVIEMLSPVLSHKSSDEIMESTAGVDHFAGHLVCEDEVKSESQKFEWNERF